MHLVGGLSKSNILKVASDRLFRNEDFRRMAKKVMKRTAHNSAMNMGPLASGYLALSYLIEFANNAHENADKERMLTIEK